MDGWQSLIAFHEARTSSFELHGDLAGRVTGCGQPGIYLVERGQLLVSVAGERHRLRSGELLLLPRSHDHVLSTRTDAAVVPMEHIERNPEPRRARVRWK